MKIHHAFPPAGERRERIVLAIGFFDGFHRGHRAIARALLRERKAGYRAAVLTFRNHPSTYLRPDDVPPMISTLEERLDNLGEAGIDEAYLLPFDAAIAGLEAATFLDEIVIGRLGARALVVGGNFRFGANRGGDARFADAHLRARGIGFVAVPQLEDRGARISSTRIRRAIAEGDVALADELLGGSYRIRGAVVVGEGRGQLLGFPTANLAVASGKLIPADGVYSCVGRHDGRDYAGLLSIGTNPTFDGKARTVEVWLRDLERTIYGEEIVLRELRFVREQRRFESAGALLEQMRADVAAVPYPSFVK
ncbi:MAG: riboflavin biosynthesis protein RibF [Candidatus Eremiobacteraeota bacterium]|nr:riboflavin biosynthesis protein RibF [Candidatus Eremiobacteraeota bacterium]